VFTSIAGRAVVVTGATRGIGKGIARVFADNGARVLIVGRDKDAAASAVAELTSGGADVSYLLADISVRRRIHSSVEVMHDSAASPCAPWLMQQIDAAIAAQGVAPQRLPSGAGHDTMAMGKLCPAGMLFVRCKDGLSHNPLESITVEDCAIGLKALTQFVRDFRAS